ncbi:MAG: hypothetical protein ABIH89_05945 [Elusimicrobiota bacterium]
MDKEKTTEAVTVVNTYLTPFAVILVLAAILFSRPSGRALYGSIILLGIAILNNIATAVLVKRFPGYRSIRMAINLAVNIILVYLLVVFWGPIWYLFLLTPVATAVYSTRKRTLMISLLMSVLLAGIYAVRGVSATVAWGQILCRIALLIFLSLFVNTLVRCHYGEN